MNQLLHRKRDASFFAHRPEVIAFGAEILKPDPDRVERVLHHIGRPIVENLHAAELHAPILHIDPAIGYDVTEGFHAGCVGDL